MKIKTLTLFIAALSLPTLLKIGLPLAVQYLFAPPDTHAYRVTAFNHSNQLKIENTLTGQTQLIELTGISIPDSQAYHEANAILQTILRGGAEPVFISSCPDNNSQQPTILELKNGTTIQEILLADGVAIMKADTDVQALLKEKFRRAEHLARFHNKNIWKRL